jgi:hypothetical protein
MNIPEEMNKIAQWLISLEPPEGMKMTVTDLRSFSSAEAEQVNVVLKFVPVGERAIHLNSEFTED